MKRGNLRSEPAKSHNLFDSEAEREDSMKDSILRDNLAWLFVKDNLILITYSSTKWPKKLKPLRNDEFNWRRELQPAI